MGAAAEALRHPARTARAALLVVATSVRLAALMRRSGLDRTLAALRSGPRLRGALADPLLHLRLVNRLLPVLPPYRVGRCLKRSLLLLALWHRCGLQVRLHLGFRPAAAGPWGGHAWLSCDGFEVPEPLASPNGHLEAFVL